MCAAGKTLKVNTQLQFIHSWSLCDTQTTTQWICYWEYKHCTAL